MKIIHYLIVAFYYLQMIRFIPAYVVFMLKHNLLMPDFAVWKKQLGYSNHGNTSAFFRIFAKYREYRFVIYYRLGYDSRAISWLAPAMPLLFCKTPVVGKGFYINHGHSTRINAKRIGDNFQVWQNVTIGVKTQFKNDTIPTIGNNVKICSGACVCGDITIGNNVTIGANSVVMKSVPDNCVVVGNPARIIYRDGVRVDEKL